MGTMTTKSTRGVLGHSLLHSLVRLHRSLVRLLRTARFARALRCAHSFARSLTHSGAHGKEVFVYEMNASISYHLKPLCSAPSPFRLEDSAMKRIRPSRIAGGPTRSPRPAFRTIIFRLFHTLLQQRRENLYGRVLIRSKRRRTFFLA